jgi:hypothetical protein
MITFREKTDTYVSVFIDYTLGIWGEMWAELWPCNQ